MTQTLIQPLAGQALEARRAHWNGVWRRGRRSFGRYYHRWLARTYRFLIPEGADVLEVGCGQGDLLAALKPGVGVGIDFSDEALATAQVSYPDLEFLCLSAESVADLDRTFDYIVLSDLVNDVWDVQVLFRALRSVCHPGTRIILNYYSQLWRLPLNLAARLDLATPQLTQNWLTIGDLEAICSLEDYEVLDDFSEMAMVLPVPGANWINRYLARIFPLNIFCIANFAVVRPVSLPIRVRDPSCSIIIAARNEAGHIEELFRRIPEFSSGQEIIFVEGHSTDDTYDVIAEAIENHPERNVKLLKQPGEGKGAAVRAGFAEAKGDVLMILDADMTVLPEDLPRFFDAITSGKGEFVNGVRLVYPMQEEAMRFFNLVGNKAFAVAFTWLLGQRVRDTLCGTKVMWRNDYETLAANRHYFGHFDPFGDFDLIFGAAKLKLKILDLPIRYHSRVYGETNISRWRHGVLLLRMVMFATRRIKFF